MNKGIVIACSALVLAACEQIELPATEYVRIEDRNIKIDGQTYILAARPKFSGGREEFVKVDGRYYECKGEGSLEDRCRKAAERALDESDMGDGY